VIATHSLRKNRRRRRRTRRCPRPRRESTHGSSTATRTACDSRLESPRTTRHRALRQSDPTPPRHERRGACPHARDRARLYDGHSHPFSSQTVKGWHARPGKETVSSRLLQQPARSPSGTGRAAFPHQPTSTRLNRCREPSQTNTGTPKVTTTNSSAVDRTRTPHCHWHLCVSRRARQRPAHDPGRRNAPWSFADPSR
jgi:hypothetical protein